MDYDWFWVLMALSIFIPAGMVPLGLARDAWRRWREYRRERRGREIAELSYQRQSDRIY